jgi:branched-chain amino acid transport system substrate-binding protein
MTNKKYKILIISVLALIIILSWIVVFRTGYLVKEDEPVKIGVIAPLSGSFSFWGENIQESLLLENAEFIFEDSKCDVKEGVSAANKLISVDNVEVIIGDICSSVTVAIAPIAEENKVVLLTPGSQSSAIKNAGDYVFRIALPNDIASKALANKVYEDGNRKVAVLYINNELGKDYEEHFSKDFIELGGEVYSESYEATEKDFSTALAKIKEKEPSALVIFTNLEGQLIAKKIKELGIKAKLYGGPTWNSKPNYAGVEEILDGLVYPVNKVAKNGEYEEFMKLFEDKYGKKPSVEWMAINSYDSINIILDIINRKGYDGKKIKEELYKINYEGVNGLIKFDENGDSFNDVQLMQLKNGKGVPLNQNGKKSSL